MAAGSIILFCMWGKYEKRKEMVTLSLSSFKTLFEVFAQQLFCHPGISQEKQCVLWPLNSSLLPSASPRSTKHTVSFDASELVFIVLA